MVFFIGWKTIRMKKIILGSVFICFALIAAVSFFECSTQERKRIAADEPGDPDAWSAAINANANDLPEKGKAVFRYETFGDEVF